MSADTLLKTIVAGAKAHKPEIMVGLGLAAGVGAIVVAVKETPKCLSAIDEATLKGVEINEETGESKPVVYSPSRKEIFLIIVKHYGLAFALELLSGILIIWGTKIRLDSYAALAAIYGLTKAERDDLKKIISEQPSNWQKKFTEKMAETHLAESDPNTIPEPRMSNAEVPMPLPLFWDDQAKVYFRMSEEDLRDAIAEFTNQITTDPFQATSMNDWMRIINHEEVVNGDYYLMTMNDADWDGALKYNQIGVKEAPNLEPARMMKFSKDYHLDTRGYYAEI